MSTPLDKRMDAEAVVATLRDGMTVGIGGWGPRRKPMSLVRAILRSDLKDLTVVAYGGPECGMLLAAGKIAKLIYGFVFHGPRSPLTRSSAMRARPTRSRRASWTRDCCNGACAPRRCACRSCRPAPGSDRTS